MSWYGRARGSPSKYSNPMMRSAGNGLASRLERTHMQTNGQSRGDMTMLTCNVCMRRGIRSQVSCGPIEELSLRLRHRVTLRRHRAHLLRQLPESLVLVISRLRLRRARLRQILIKKDAKSERRPGSFTKNRAGIHRNKSWKPFQFPIRNLSLFGLALFKPSRPS